MNGIDASWVRRIMEVPSRHLRRRRKIAPGEFLDEQKQENLLEKFTEQARMQAQLYRVVFAVVLLLPSPAFIFAPLSRNHPRIAFLSLFSLAVSVYSIRSKAPRVPLLQRLNLLLGVLVLLQVWLRTRHKDISRADFIWFFPLVAALSSFLLYRWLQQVQREIRKLADARYELKGV